MKSLAIYAFIFILGIAFAQAIYYFSAMPDPMASHFGFGGEANGYLSRNAFFIGEAFVFLIMIFSFILTPWLFEKKKVSNGINLPNKAYWLAPIRIDDFYKYFRTSFAWFGVVTLILLVGSLQLVFEANFLSKPVLNEKIFLALFCGYMGFVIIWIISFYRKFSKVE